MSDDTQPQVEAPAQPPAAPAPAPASVSLTPEIEALLNERIAGVQRTFQQQLNDRDERIRQLQSASLSEEEREQLAAEERDEELARLETENWLLKQSQKNPKAAEAFQKVLEADDPDAQFEYIASLLAASTPAPAPTPEPETQVPDVDPNNPPIYSQSNQDTITLPDGRVITEADADRILAGLQFWPGSR